MACPKEAFPRPTRSRQFAQPKAPLPFPELSTSMDDVGGGHRCVTGSRSPTNPSESQGNMMQKDLGISALVIAILAVFILLLGTWLTGAGRFVGHVCLRQQARLSHPAAIPNPLCR